MRCERRLETWSTTTLDSQSNPRSLTLQSTSFCQTYYIDIYQRNNSTCTVPLPVFLAFPGHYRAPFPELYIQCSLYHHKGSYIGFLNATRDIHPGEFSFFLLGEVGCVLPRFVGGTMGFGIESGRDFSFLLLRGHSLPWALHATFD
jgi:hypothetical protein